MFSLLSACARNELVRADDMSAAQHRAEAQKQRDAALRAASLSGSDGGQPSRSSDPAAYDPADERRREAEHRAEHARQHRAAAEFLEQFEDRACLLVPSGSRAACPLLGPVVRLVEIADGIRVTFADAKRAKTVISEMLCHYAYARARHFDETISCPLYVRGIEIRQGLEPSSIEIVSRDDKTVRLIRERGREQAVFVPGLR